MDGTKSLDADLGVALRRLEASMAEHLGDVADVGPTLEHQGGHAMAEQMAAPSLVDPRLTQIGPHLAAEPVRADRSSDGRQEQNRTSRSWSRAKSGSTSPTWSAEPVREGTLGSTRPSLRSWIVRQHIPTSDTKPVIKWARSDPVGDPLGGWQQGRSRTGPQQW